MTSISDALTVPLADAQLLNARRYGLTEKQLSQFTEIMTAIEKKKSDAPDSVTPDGVAKDSKDSSELSTTDIIRDYIKQRMTDRMTASMGDGRYLGEFSADAMANPQDLILGMAGAPRKQSSDLSGLLNMHFDLYTLQMFS